jgi:hypothetical protein
LIACVDAAARREVRPGSQDLLKSATVLGNNHVLIE